MVSQKQIPVDIQLIKSAKVSEFVSIIERLNATREVIIQHLTHRVHTTLNSYNLLISKMELKPTTVIPTLLKSMPQKTSQTTVRITTYYFQTKIKRW